MLIKAFLRRQLLKHRALILEEGHQLSDFMRLLMKRRNAGDVWTREEKARLRSHLKHLSWYVPALIIFLLPFGSLLIPVLAEILDRRKDRRIHGEAKGN